MIHRLGEDLSVRLPRHAGAITQAAKEAEWLPRLAPHLPLAVPVPVRVGRPALGYPVALGGVPLAGRRGRDRRGTRGFDPGRRPAGGVPHRASRVRAAGLPGTRHPEGPDHPAARRPGPRHASRHRGGRRRIRHRGHDPAVERGAERPRMAPPPPVLVHGDFDTGNLLTAGGRLSAVIDFGELGIGDPACDLTIAFTLMSAASRAVFRAALGVDDATWTRGRGWALATGLNAYTAYADADPRVAAQTTRQITEALTG
nr:phosphotransferase [Streptomyces sp. WAC07149]